MRLTLPYSPKELDTCYYDYYETMYFDGMKKHNNLSECLDYIRHSFIKEPRVNVINDNSGTSYQTVYEYHSTYGTYLVGSYFEQTYRGDHNPYLYIYPEPIWRTNWVPIPNKIEYCISLPSTNRISYYSFKIRGYPSNSEIDLELSRFGSTSSNAQSFINKISTFTNLKSKLNINDTMCRFEWAAPIYCYYGARNFKDTVYGTPSKLYLKYFEIQFK